jgi:hypothetical protein
MFSMGAQCITKPVACTTDADCVQTDACRTGTCGTGGTCDVADVSCPEGQDCDGGTCKTPCTADTVCNDADGCTVDVCGTDGFCGTSGATDCDDADACTTDGCVAATGCTHTDVDCDDNVACTDDACADGTCSHSDNCAAGEQCNATTGACDALCAVDADCDDATFCNGAETCSADGICVAGTDPCTDNGVFCDGTESCDVATDACVSSGDPCAVGTTCDEATAACLTEVACTLDADCDDGLFCNGAETCVIPVDATEGVCADGTRPCDDTDADANVITCDAGAAQSCDEGDIAAVCTNCPGETRNFTLEVDTLTGSTSDDTFLAPTALTGLGAQTATLQNGDSANGLAGADVLTAYLVNGGAALTIAPTLAGIETFNFTDYSTTFTTTIIADAITGAATINLTGGLNDTADGFSINNLPSVVNVGMTNTSEDFELVYTSAAASGASNSMILTLSNSTDSAVASRSEVRISSGAANGIETITIDSVGSANRLRLLTQTPNAGTTSSSLATLNITGDQDLQIGDIVTGVGVLDNSVLTVNAGAATDIFTGKILEIAVGTGAVAFTGGSGDDTVNYGANYTTSDVINGGDGTDYLGLTTAFAAAAVAQSNVTNIEGLRISNAHTTAVTLSRWGTVNRVILDAGSNGGTLTYPAGTNYLSLGAFGTDPAPAGTTTVVISGSATSDVLNLTVNDCDETGAVALTGAETVNLASNIDLDGSAASGAANVFGAAFTVTDGAGTQTLNITGAAAVTFTGAVTANVIDGSAATGAITMTVASVGASSVKGGSANDVLYGVAATGDAIDGNGGNDTIYGGDGGGADIVSGGAGADEFRFDDSVASGGLAAAAVVSDWTDGVDFIGISAADTFAAGGATGLALGGGADGTLVAAAAGATVLKSVAQNAAASAIGATEQFIKLTTAVAAAATDQLTFNAAIGTATVTGLTAATTMAGSYYDTTNSQMVLFAVLSTGTTTTIVETADVIRVIARINMTSTDYTNFTTADLLIY